MGKRSKESSAAYTDIVNRADKAPAKTPTRTHPSSPFTPMKRGCSGTGNNGPNPKRYRRRTAATALANATGIRLRGFHSNKSSSTASKTDATGAAKVADIPAAAPATNSVLRSVLVKWNNCAIIDPIAPPVIMMGPSAPKGPPDPIEIADEMGFNNATFG